MFCSKNANKWDSEGADVGCRMGASTSPTIFIATHHVTLSCIITTGVHYTKSDFFLWYHILAMYRHKRSMNFNCFSPFCMQTPNYWSGFHIGSSLFWLICEMWAIASVRSIFIVLGLKVLTAAVLDSSIFFDITPCSPLKPDWRFGGSCHSTRYMPVSSLVCYSTPKKEATCSSGTFIDFQRNTRCYRPPLWSGGQSSWLQIQRSRVRFPEQLDFLRSSGSGTRFTQPREDNWGAVWMKK
jgi:hypothetical protein